MWKAESERKGLYRLFCVSIGECSGRGKKGLKRKEGNKLKRTKRLVARGTNNDLFGSVGKV